jgi:hypothetical protein
MRLLFVCDRSVGRSLTLTLLEADSSRSSLLDFHDRRIPIIDCVRLADKAQSDQLSLFGLTTV